MKLACLIHSLLCLVAAVTFAQDAEAPIVDRARLLPAPDAAAALSGGIIAGSNMGETVGFVELGKVADTPAAGQWCEVKLDNRTPYRWVKYIGPKGSNCRVAEIEFYQGDRKLVGKPFGIAGTRNEKQNCFFDAALDGKAETWFDAPLADDAYAGLDLATGANTTPAPSLEPAPGSHEKPIRLAIRAPAGASVRYTTNGVSPGGENGRVYDGPVELSDGFHSVAAIAAAPGKFPSAVVSGAYRIGSVPPPRGLKTYSTGNSLSDTFAGMMAPLARSAGYDHKHHRFSIPGAPTDWLWAHPRSGFGDSDYPKAFKDLAPIDILITQPFSGHGRSIENEAQHSGNFYRLARESSPGIRLYLYQQWPGAEFKKESWSQLVDAGWSKEKYLAALRDKYGVKPAETWEQAIVNHLAYFQELRETMQARFPGETIHIVPAGLALKRLKEIQDAGRLPGRKPGEWFIDHFSKGPQGPGTDFHLTKPGAYLVTLTLYCAFYKEAPDKVILPPEQTGLSAEQDAVYKRIAWDTVRTYPYAGIMSPPKPGEVHKLTYLYEAKPEQ